MEQIQNTLLGDVIVGGSPYSISVSKTSTPGDDEDTTTDTHAIRIVLPGTTDTDKYPKAALDFGSRGNPANYEEVDFEVDGNDLVAEFFDPDFGDTTWVDVYVKVKENNVTTYDYIVTISKTAFTTSGYTFVYAFDPAA